MNDRKTDLEMIECARMNFENLERAYPLIKKHLFYIIAKAQLDDGLGYVPIEESLKKVEANL